MYLYVDVYNTLCVLCLCVSVSVRSLRVCIYMILRSLRICIYVYIYVYNAREACILRHNTQRAVYTHNFKEPTCMYIYHFKEPTYMYIDVCTALCVLCLRINISLSVLRVWIYTHFVMYCIRTALCVGEYTQFPLFIVCVDIHRSLCVVCVDVYARYIYCVCGCNTESLWMYRAYTSTDTIHISTHTKKHVPTRTIHQESVDVYLIFAKEPYPQRLFCGKRPAT